MSGAHMRRLLVMRWWEQHMRTQMCLVGLAMTMILVAEASDEPSDSSDDDGPGTALHQDGLREELRNFLCCITITICCRHDMIWSAAFHR